MKYLNRKVLLVARPDHSRFLYEGVKNDVSVNYLTFGVAKNNTILSILFPNSKVVSKEVSLSYVFTLVNRLLFKVTLPFNINIYNIENFISNISFYPYLHANIKNVAIIHYWPLYCYQSVEKIKNKYPNIITIADVYMANPDHIQGLLEDEYKVAGIDINSAYCVRGRDREINSIKNAEYIIVPSNYVKETYLPFIAANKIFVIGYGVHNYSEKSLVQYYQKIKNYDLKAKSLNIVYVGNISIEKGCHYLLDAMASFTDSVKLTLIGSVPPNQQRVFQKYNDKKNIIFYGSTSNTEVMELLPTFDCFALLSLSDAYSLAVSEAISCGLPVIISEHTGNKDDVIKYDVGIVCKVKSTSSIIEAIKMMECIDIRYKYLLNIENFINSCKEHTYPSKVLSLYKQLSV